MVGCTDLGTVADLSLSAIQEAGKRSDKKLMPMPDRYPGPGLIAANWFLHPLLELLFIRAGIRECTFARGNTLAGTTEVACFNYFQEIFCSYLMQAIDLMDRLPGQKYLFELLIMKTVLLNPDIFLVTSAYYDNDTENTFILT